MQVKLPYGKTYLTVDVDDAYDTTLIEPHFVPPAENPRQVVGFALKEADIQLEHFAAAKTVAIAINDKTRPVPHDHLLPPLLDRLHEIGFSRENITFIIATGTHPVMPSDEYAMILPPNIIESYTVLCHDAYDDASVAYLGETSRGTPVYANRAYLAADVRLVVGNMEPHQFMGFSGGVKSAAIGLAGHQTISHNHALMMQDQARLGEYENNPARQDVEEIGRMLEIHFALNALLNNKKQIVNAIAGNPVTVMQRGIPLVKAGFQVPVSAPFDLMLVSPGGHPKDINVYQTQKALAHAAMVTKHDGTIIITAACGEGTGSDHYEDWLFAKETPSHQAVFDRFHQEPFVVGPHKAFQISRDASKFRVILVSDMEPTFVERLLLEPSPDLATALKSALTNLSHRARIGIMPVANATIPLLES